MIHNAELTAALRDVTKGYYYEPFQVKFRASSLPFCPILYVLDTQQHTTNDGQRKVEFEKGFYTKIGHAIHATWQDTARHSLPNNLIGDWRCQRVLEDKTKGNVQIIRRCHQEINFCSFAQAGKQLHCPHGKKHCANYLDYQELAGDLDDMTGHTDFLYYSRRGSYHLVDIKTTSNFLFEVPDKAADYYPNPRYVIQLRIYIAMLEKKYNIRIKDFTIAYVAREKALHVGRDKKRALRLFTFKVTDKIRQRTRRDVVKYKRRFNIARQWLQGSRRQRRQLTDKLYQARPCHTRKQYLEEMAQGFLSNAPCEYHKNGACYNGKMLHQLEAMV